MKWIYFKFEGAGGEHALIAAEKPRPLRCRIVLTIAVKTRKLELKSKWFPGFKGERYRFFRTIPSSPLG
ncbi:hypothetical protein [Paenibacillus lautus]|uniref:Uncharacterized protein n=1 Tax=Paenibacillus lautus TaxID=1401 RepID=A0A385TL94_PAELA|nr:hypothetical protein [Paenibacillus lautus]AYB41955.1 hypothetical protein D5F53_00985 [Paenibacillus lautus]MBY0165264.1 hypothetical protein [Cytobacillus firmus]